MELTEKVFKKIELCIDPLDRASHPSSIINIVSGQIRDTHIIPKTHYSIPLFPKISQLFLNFLPIILKVRPGSNVGLFMCRF